MKHEGSSVVIALVLVETEFDLGPPEKCRWAFPSWQITTVVISQLGNAFLTSSVLDELRGDQSTRKYSRGC